MLKDKSLTDFANFFSPNNFKKEWWYDFKLDFRNDWKDNVQ